MADGVVNDMTKNPLLNAVAAVLYIALIALVMFYGLKTVKDETILIPITVLSLFVLSAAVMGSIFFYQPVRLCLEGEKPQAVNLFLKTLAVFAAITAMFLVILLVKS